DRRREIKKPLPSSRSGLASRVSRGLSGRGGSEAVSKPGGAGVSPACCRAGETPAPLLKPLLTAHFKNRRAGALERFAFARSDRRLACRGHKNDRRAACRYGRGQTALAPRFPQPQGAPAPRSPAFAIILHRPLTPSSRRWP